MFKAKQTTHIFCTDSNQNLTAYDTRNREIGSGVFVLGTGFVQTTHGYGPAVVCSQCRILSN